MKCIVQVQDALCMPFQHALIMSVSYQQYITNQSLMPNHVNTNSYVVCTSCPKCHKPTLRSAWFINTASPDGLTHFLIYTSMLPEFMCLYSVIIDLNMLCCTWKLEQPKNRCFPYLIQWCFMYCMSMYLCRWLSVTNVVAWQSAPVDARLSAWTLLLTLKLLVNMWNYPMNLWRNRCLWIWKHRKQTSKRKVLTHCKVFVYSMIMLCSKTVHICHHDLP